MKRLGSTFARDAFALGVIGPMSQSIKVEYNTLVRLDLADGTVGGRRSALRLSMKVPPTPTSFRQLAILDGKQGDAKSMPERTPHEA